MYWFLILIWTVRCHHIALGILQRHLNIYHSNESWLQLNDQDDFVSTTSRGTWVAFRCTICIDFEFSNLRPIPFDDSQRRSLRFCCVYVQSFKNYLISKRKNNSERLCSTWRHPQTVLSPCSVGKTESRITSPPCFFEIEWRQHKRIGHIGLKVPARVLFSQFLV